MVDKTLAQLDASGVLAGSNLLLVDQGGSEPKKATLDNLLTFLVEPTQDVVGAMVQGSGGLSASYNDATGFLTITPTSDLSVKARVEVRKDNTAIGSRRAINFKNSPNVTVTAVDDPGNEEVEVSFDLSATVGVGSFNTRTGAVTLTSGDVTSALGFTPIPAADFAGNLGAGLGISGGGDMSGSVTIAFDPSELSTLSAVDGGADYIVMQDTSAGVPVRVLAKDARPTESIVIAVSDETTPLTTGTAKVTFRMPYAFVVTAVRSNVGAASSSGLVTADINEGGTSILGANKLSIDATEKTSVTAAAPTTIADPNLADDAEITIDIDAAGTGAKGLKVTIIGYRA